jgi:hypothetical protein
MAPGRKVTPLPTTPIWRYLDPRRFDGLLGLLTRRAIYVSRVDCVLKGDPREASYPTLDREKRGERHMLRPDALERLANFPTGFTTPACGRLKDAVQVGYSAGGSR